MKALNFREYRGDYLRLPLTRLLEPLPVRAGYEVLRRPQHRTAVTAAEYEDSITGL